jgi:SAM-dependent methyltransferase
MISCLKRIARPLAIRMGWTKEPKSVRVEKSSNYYDRLYAGSEEYQLAYPDSRYYFVWTVIVDRIRRECLGRILEIGCGSGQLARFLLDQGITSYTGIDFSGTAISLASARCPEGCFLVADARFSDVYAHCKRDVIIATEVLEHVEDDLDVVSRFPPGIRCICSVPSFPYESHVRHFSSASEVTDRYAPYFTDFDVFTLRVPGASLFYYLFDGRRNTFSQPGENG